MKWAGLQDSSRDGEKQNSNLSWEPNTGISYGLDVGVRQ